MVQKNFDWREQINRLNSEMPTEGSEAPIIEKIPPQVDISKIPVIVQRLVTTVYVISDLEGHKYTSVAGQSAKTFEQMTMGEALKMAQKDTK